MSLDTRTQILRAAAQCIARAGVRGLRMSHVCRAAGVSSGLLYYHFTDRDGLLAATLAHINEAAAQPRSTPISTSDTTEHASAVQMTRLIDNLVDEIIDEAAVRDDAAAWHEIGASAVFDDTLAKALADTTTRWQARIADAFERAYRDAPEPAPLDGETFAVLATALVDGITARWLTGRLDTHTARQMLRSGLNAWLV